MKIVSVELAWMPCVWRTPAARQVCVSEVSEERRTWTDVCGGGSRAEGCMEAQVSGGEGGNRNPLLCRRVFFFCRDRQLGDGSCDGKSR